jgi:hypothetical protein
MPVLPERWAECMNMLPDLIFSDNRGLMAACPVFLCNTPIILYKKMSLPG